MYKLTPHSSVIRIEDGATIPFDAGNADYRAYLAWVAEGNEATPADPVPVPEQIVSRFQARAALHLAGALDAVEALMSDPNTDPIARIAWQDAQTFRRYSPTVVAMSAALGMTDEEVDQLFVTAAQIEA